MLINKWPKFLLLRQKIYLHFLRPQSPLIAFHATHKLWNTQHSECVVRFDYFTKWTNSSTLWRYLDTIFKTIQIESQTKELECLGHLQFCSVCSPKPLERTTWRNQSGATWGTGTNFVELVPSFFGHVNAASLACVASVSSRVRRESWDESKKKISLFYNKYQFNRQEFLKWWIFSFKEKLKDRCFCYLLQEPCLLLIFGWRDRENRGYVSAC